MRGELFQLARLTALPVAAAVLVACAGEEETTVASTTVIEAPPPPPAEDVVPPPDPNAPAYVGVWASSVDGCDEPPGSSETAPVAISEGEFVAGERFCRLGLVEETDAGWKLELYCDDDEGVEVAETVDIIVDGSSLTVTGANGAAQTYQSCVA